MQEECAEKNVRIISKMRKNLSNNLNDISTSIPNQKHNIKTLLDNISPSIISEEYKDYCQLEFDANDVIMPENLIHNKLLTEVFLRLLVRNEAHVFQDLQYGRSKQKKNFSNSIDEFPKLSN